MFPPPGDARFSQSISGSGNSFSVTVPACTLVVLNLPVVSNTPPVLSAISNRTVNAGEIVSFTASATDTDAPPQLLTFTLLGGASNATLNASSGAFSWRPWVTQSDTTNSFALKVADNGSPSLSATQSFSVTVNALTAPSFSSVVWTDGQVRLALAGTVGPDYAIQASTNLTDWETIFMTNSPSLPLSWTDPDSVALRLRFYRIAVGPPLP